MRRIAFICTTLGLCAPLHSENWPRFRGPTGQGISAEKGLPLRWSANSNLVWKTEIPGRGWSSPVVWDDRLFVTSATDNGVSCRVSGLDLKTGEILWNTKVFEQVPLRKEGKNSYATSTPCADGRIYFLSEQGESVVIEAGPQFRILARNSIGEKCQASYAVAQQQIFIRSEKNIYCIGQSAASGKAGGLKR